MMTEPRAFVLVPGAGGAAWYWHRVVPLLRGAGHEAVAVDLPGPDPAAGLPEYARLVRAAVTSLGAADVVLIAQSLGAFTAPLAAAPPVSAIVLVNAMIPVPGETPGAWWENSGQPRARLEAAGRHGYATEFDVDTYFLHDVPAEVLASGEEPRVEADAVFESVCDFSAWPVPVTVVAGADDRFFPVGFQQGLARDRIGVTADVLPGGHLIALSQPYALVKDLLGL
jgi:pimeloyl-ACP methyl ester carboxylesterase